MDKSRSPQAVLKTNYQTKAVWDDYVGLINLYDAAGVEFAQMALHEKDGRHAENIHNFDDNRNELVLHINLATQDEDENTLTKLPENIAEEAFIQNIHFGMLMLGFNPDKQNYIVEGTYAGPELSDEQKPFMEKISAMAADRVRNHVPIIAYGRMHRSL